MTLHQLQIRAVASVDMNVKKHKTLPVDAATWPGLACLGFVKSLLDCCNGASFSGVECRILMFQRWVRVTSSKELSRQNANLLNSTSSPVANM